MNMEITRCTYIVYRLSCLNKTFGVAKVKTLYYNASGQIQEKVILQAIIKVQQVRVHTILS